MNKKILLIIFIVIILIAAAIFGFLKYGSGQEQGQEQENEIVLFYGEGCPHCANVDKFIEENKIEEKLSFVRKEVFSNAANAKELTKIAQQCELSSSAIGVPFLWDKENCVVGDVNVINFFKQKIGIK